MWLEMAALYVLQCLFWTKNTTLFPKIYVVL